MVKSEKAQLPPVIFKQRGLCKEILVTGKICLLAAVYGCFNKIPYLACQAAGKDEMIWK